MQPRLHALAKPGSTIALIEKRVCKDKTLFSLYMSSSGVLGQVHYRDATGYAVELDCCLIPFSAICWHDFVLSMPRFKRSYIPILHTKMKKMTYLYSS